MTQPTQQKALQKKQATKKIFLNPTTLALVNAIMLAGAAHGQSTNAPNTKATGTNAAVQLPDVVVKGQQQGDSYKTDSVELPKVPLPLRDTAQSITVVPRQVMDDQNNTTLRDALRNVAGISIAAGEGGSQGDNLTLRGFSARNDIFLDGMRDFGSYYRDPFDLQQVDVLKGPDSITFGRGTTGGVINQQSKTPTLDPLISGTLSLGTDLTRRLAVDVNEPVPSLGEHTAFRVNMMGHQSEVAGRDVTENSRFGFAPSLTLGLGTPTRVTFSYFHQSADDIPDYGIPWLLNKPAPVERHNFYGFQDDHLRTVVDVGTIQLEHDFNDQIKLRDQLRYANFDRDFRITEPKINNPLAPSLDQMTVSRNEINGKSSETFLGDQLDLMAHVETGPVEHVLVSGVEFGRETSDPTRFTLAGVPTTSLVNPNEDQSFSGASSIRSKVKATADSFAVYGMDTMKFGDHWLLGGGVRWDYFDADVRQSAPTALSFNRIDKKPTWRGALVYKPIEIGSIYFDYGTSFNPSAESLSLTAGTANLPPEENQTFEFGTKWDLLDHRLSLRGALFRTDKTNAREPSVVDPTLMALSGNQRVDGIEVEAAGYLTKNWEVFAGYDYMDGEVITSLSNPASIGGPIANCPKHTFSLWTTYELPWKIEVGTGVKYISSRIASTTYDAITGLPKTAPDYWTMDAMVKYHLTKNIDLQVNVYNLTDEYYLDQLHPAHVVPGAGRSALFSANFKF